LTTLPTLYTKITCTLHGDQYALLIITRSVRLKMRIVLDKTCRDNQNINFMSNIPPPFENHAVYEIMWRTILQLGRPHMLHGARASHVGYAALKTHTQNKQSLYPFLRNKVYTKGASVIRYTCIACLVFFNNINEAYLIQTDRWKLCSETLTVFCQVLRFSTGAPVLSPSYMLPFSARIPSHTSFSTAVRP